MRRTSRTRLARIVACATPVSGLLVALALCVVLRPLAAHAQRSLLASFHAAVEEPAARRVRFEWTVSPERADEDMSCTIDIDVDDATNVDASVPNCDEDTSFEHTYAEPGRYRAALTVASAAGGSERVITTVVVD